jgi:hypothetical protein
MATWTDVERFATAMPEVTDGIRFETRVWRVKDKGFVWERPLRKRDLEELGDAAPAGPILGVRVADLDEQRALVQSEADYCFITTHFAGYPAVLVQLDKVPIERLRELVTDAWLACAPKRLASGYLDGTSAG